MSTAGGAGSALPSHHLNPNTEITFTSSRRDSLNPHQIDLNKRRTSIRVPIYEEDAAATISNGVPPPSSLSIAAPSSPVPPKWASRLMHGAVPGGHRPKRGRRTALLLALFLAFSLGGWAIGRGGGVAGRKAKVVAALGGRLSGVVEVVSRRLEIPSLTRVRGSLVETLAEPLDILDLINFAEPQETLKMQLKEGVRYVTSMTYGGHANQFISIGKLLYYAKISNRVAIIPTLLSVHFKADPVPLSTFFDLPLFYRLSSIPHIEFTSLKALAIPDTPQNEGISCWSIAEATIGEANLVAHSFDIHNIDIEYWALPPMSRGLGGFDIAYDSLKVFDFDQGAREQWLQTIKNESIPQLPDGTGLKVGFNPSTAAPPDDQLFCLDNTLFLGPVIFPPAFLPKVPHEPRIAGEGIAWEGATQYLHFTREVEDKVDRALLRLFRVTSLARVPPFISVHLRRGDFEQFAGFTALDAYAAAVDRVVEQLQYRLDNPDSWTGPGKAHFRTFPRVPANEYAIVATTDEESGSEFLQEVKGKGWVVVDHEALGTEQGWWPTILDAALLARGQGFVGTDRSTFSHLAGLRVKYWRGGVTDVAIEAPPDP